MARSLPPPLEGRLLARAPQERALRSLQPRRAAYGEDYVCARAETPSHHQYSLHRDLKVP